ncbi:hypothetical protein [Streptomyces sp. YIM 132580]|uniref:hypothetical protein n=1 Tax=Streptomyces sp. YIM 132580 TaxID=2691958 RepID=UPI0019289C40|nr:hypothetical protein [Streptomyces sp. YIM 132580]
MAEKEVVPRRQLEQDAAQQLRVGQGSPASPPPPDHLRRAPAADGATPLVAPLAAVRSHLPSGQRQSAGRIDSLTRRTGEPREDTAARRRNN